MGIFGWFGPGQQKIYNEILSNVQHGGRVLEIGCLLGKSTHYLANLLKDKEVELYCCDPWESSTASSGEQYCKMLEAKYGKDLYFEFKKNVSEFDFIKPYKMTSSEFFKNLSPDIKFDRIYIDGSHEYEFVKSDIIESLKCIKEDGIIAGDDHPSPGVFKAVKEIFGTSVELDKSPRQWVFDVVKNKDLYAELLKV